MNSDLGISFWQDQGTMACRGIQGLSLVSFASSESSHFQQESCHHVGDYSWLRVSPQRTWQASEMAQWLEHWATLFPRRPDVNPRTQSMVAQPPLALVLGDPVLPADLPEPRTHMVGRHKETTYLHNNKNNNNNRCHGSAG